MLIEDTSDIFRHPDLLLVGAFIFDYGLMDLL